MTDAELDAIEAVARAATQGEWGVRVSCIGPYIMDITDRDDLVIAETSGLNRAANAAYIHALQPVAVLSLIAEIRRLRMRLWKAPKAIAAPEQEWPAGCHDIITCQKNRTCGYHQCIHTGKGAFLGAEIDAAMSDVGDKP